VTNWIVGKSIVLATRDEEVLYMHIPVDSKAAQFKFMDTQLHWGKLVCPVLAN